MQFKRPPELLKRRVWEAPRLEEENTSDYRSWIISFLTHISLLLFLAIWIRPISKGTGGGEFSSGIELSTSSDPEGGGDGYLAGGSPSSKKSGQLATDSESLSNPTTGLIAGDVVVDGEGMPVGTPGSSSLEDLVADLLTNDGDSFSGEAVEGALGTGIAGTGTGPLVGSGPGTGRETGKTTTGFMGVSGTGRSFVFVLDRSDSMNEWDGAPIATAKRELMKSISSLKDYNQFQIVFYNDAPNALLDPRGSKNRLLFADDNEKRRAEDFIRGISASGGTEHTPAIRVGLTYSPDVIFFMTDGERPGISESEMADIQQRAASAQTTIHAIQFRAGPQAGTGGWIRTLAERNRGTYRYIDITQLKADE